MLNLIEDISKLSNIPQSILNKLVNIAKFCVCDCLIETKLKNESLSEIDLGLGKLNILVSEDQIEYQFIPSRSLEKNIKTAVIKNKNPLEIAVEDSLNTRIKNTYKELL